MTKAFVANIGSRFVGVSMPSELRDALAALATRKRTTVSAIVRQAIERELRDDDEGN